MNPARVLDELGLLKDRLSTPEYQMYMQAFEEDVYRKKAGPVMLNDKNEPSGYMFCQRERKHLGMADAYYLAAEMMPLVRWGLFAA